MQNDPLCRVWERNRGPLCAKLIEGEAVSGQLHARETTTTLQGSLQFEQLRSVDEAAEFLERLMVAVHASLRESSAP